MKKLPILLVSILTLLGCGTMMARNDWYDHPLALAAGTTLMGNVKAPVGQMRLHARTDASEWSLIFDKRDAQNYVKLTLSIPSANYGENDLYRPECEVTAEKVVDGSRVHSQQKKVAGVFSEGKNVYNSLVVIYDGVSVRVSGGAGNSEELFTLPFAPTGGDVAIESTGPAGLQRITIESETLPRIPFAPFFDVEELEDYIAVSSDPLEAVWGYLDRENDTSAATIGGRYKLASVKADDGYLLVYLSGADIGRDQWEPLMVKGELTPTIHAGNYDMKWNTADGRILDADTNAQISDDGTVLTLRFPLQKTVIRMRRVPKNK